MPEDERDDAETARENANERDDDLGPAGDDHETTPEAEESATEPAEVADDEVPGDDVAVAALEQFDDVVFHDSRGQAVLYATPERWVELVRWLRDEQGFESLLDLCGVDHLLNARRPVPAGVAPQRFEVVVNLLSRSRQRRLRLICQVPGADPVVPSLVDLHPGADWAERETYDLFGIRFEGHPDLTRILLPEDWEGWPLRKDDPTARVPVQFKGPKETPFQQARPSIGAAGGEVVE